MKLENLEMLSDSGDKYVRKVASHSEKLKEVASSISQDKGRVMILYNPDEDAHYIDDLNAIPYVDVQFMIDCTDKEYCKIANTKIYCDVIVITENVDTDSIFDEISSAPYYNGIPIIKIGGCLEDYDECNRLVYNTWKIPFINQCYRILLQSFRNQ